MKQENRKNKWCFNGEEKEDYMKITSREVKPTYKVLIKENGHILEYDWVYLSYFGVFVSIAMLGMCGAMILEKKKT